MNHPYQKPIEKISAIVLELLVQNKYLEHLPDNHTGKIINEEFFKEKIDSSCLITLQHEIEEGFAWIEIWCYEYPLTQHHAQAVLLWYPKRYKFQWIDFSENMCSLPPALSLIGERAFSVWNIDLVKRGDWVGVRSPNWRTYGFYEALREIARLSGKMTALSVLRNHRLGWKTKEPKKLFFCKNPS